jgi:hypothetical protein
MNGLAQYIGKEKYRMCFGEGEKLIVENFFSSLKSKYFTLKIDFCK